MSNEDKKYNFNYEDFDPDKEYNIDNEKISRTHQQILGDAVRGTQLYDYWQQEENRERLVERCRDLGLLSKELGLVEKNMDKGRETMWVHNYEKYAENLREHIRNWGPEILAKLSAGGKKGGKNSHKNGTSPKQLRQLELVRDPQKAADARKVIECTVCGKEGLTGNINRWHNDNCKIQKLKEVAIKHLPRNEFRFFDITEIIEIISKESGFKPGPRGSTISKLKQYNIVEKTNTKGVYICRSI